MNQRRVAIFLGTRPEAVKLVPVYRALARVPGCEPLVISTGQHKEMLDQVLGAAGIPVHRDLQVMARDQSLASLGARLLERVDAALAETAFDLALVQGDTTTVLMAALACFYRHVPFGHVEAGLRTGDMSKPFPEEANRRLVTPLAALHFAPTNWACDNLLREGVPADRVHVTGNTVIDALQQELARQSDPRVRARIDAWLDEVLGRGWRERRFVLVTGHRRESFGAGFAAICRALATLAQRFPAVRFVYPVHLNPNVHGPVRDALGAIANVTLLPPLDYELFVTLLSECKIVLTDSGGVQEEAPGLGKPVLVMRDTTERPEGVEAGTARLVGADESRIVDGVSVLLTDEAAWARMALARNPYGDGKAAERIATIVAAFWG